MVPHQSYMQGRDFSRNSPEQPNSTTLISIQPSLAKKSATTGPPVEALAQSSLHSQSGIEIEPSGQAYRPRKHECQLCMIFAKQSSHWSRENDF